LVRSYAAEFLALVVLAGATRIGAQVVAPPAPSSPVPTQNKIQKNTTAAPKPCALPGISAQRVQEAVDASSMLQPPLAADAMIRIAAKVAAPCPALAKDLLQHAFDQADSVEPETAYKLAVPGGSTDSRVSYSEHGYSQQMDRLSLQSRAVLGMAPLDAKTAIQLFQRIPPPRPPAVGCSSAFVPDVSIYYEALGKEFALLRARKPRNDAVAQAPLAQLQDVVGATTSPVQMKPLTAVIEGAELTDTELSLLMNALAAGIESFPVDDRSLSAKADEGDLGMAGIVADVSHGHSPMPSESSLLLVDVMYDLVALSKRSKISPYPLVHAYRDYLDRSLHGPHCQGNLPKGSESLTSTCKALNAWLAKFAPGIEPVSIPDSDPPVEPDPDQGQYWLSPKTKELLMDAKHLNFDDNWRRFTDADRKTPEWQDRVGHLLNDMDDWRPTDEPDPAAYYHQRCILIYRVLADLPPGALYDRVVSAWIATFADSSLQWDNPAEWYFEVSKFLEFSKKDRKAPTPAAAIASLKNSSNSYLHALGVLAEFLQ
jgi:hypothetical protein